MPRPPAVLLVVDTFSDTGSLRWAHTLATLWMGAGWRVGYFSLKPGHEGRLLAPPAGAQVSYGDTTGERLRRVLPRTLARGVRAVAGFDVVLTTGEVGLSLPVAYLVARVSRRPFVVYVQSIPDITFELHLTACQRPLWRFCLTRADAVLCVSPASASSAVGLGVQPARITVASTGIDVDVVRRRGSVQEAEPATAAEKPVLVACGELAPRKGYDLLVRAVAGVHEAGHEVRLVVIGQGTERSALERLARDLGISDVVTFLGQVDDPVPVIAGATAFVHSARVEAMGLVLFEALALGVPVIATDCAGGGPRLVLDGGRYGRLVEPESVPALVDAVCAHLENPAQLLQQARDGEGYLRERFLPARTAAIALDVLARARRAWPPRRRRVGAGGAVADPVASTDAE